MRIVFAAIVAAAMCGQASAATFTSSLGPFDATPSVPYAPPQFQPYQPPPYIPSAPQPRTFFCQHLNDGSGLTYCW